MRKLNAETQSGNRNSVIFSTVLIVLSLFHLLTIGPPAQRWGDPAQYIYHAKNIVQGLPYTQTGHILSRYQLQLAPEAYPPGLPLLLAPIYHVFGLNLVAFKLEIWIFLSVLFVLLYFRFRNELPDGYLFIFLILFALNPWLIEFKQGILSEIPFTAIVYGASLVLLFQQEESNAWLSVLVIISFFFAYMIRAVGVILLPAFFIYDLWRKRSFSSRLVVITLITGVLILLSTLVFPGNSSYIDTIRSWTPKIIVRNLIHYNDILRSFWPAIPHFSLGREVLYLSLNTFAFLGFIRKYLRGFSFLDFFAFPYCAVLLCWPSRMGVRALLPILPLYLLYILLGWRVFIQKLFEKSSVRLGLSGFFCASILFSYVIGVSAALKEVNTIPDGPQVDEAIQLFSYIRGNTSPGSVFAFRKPRSLALFAEREATDHPAHLGGSVVLEYFDDVGVDYVVVDLGSDKDQAQLWPFIQAEQYQQIYSNERFLMYQVDSGNGENK